MQTKLMRTLFGGLALVVSVTSISPVWAVSSKRLTVQQLTQASDLIVRGQVLSVRSAWNEDRSAIYTRTELKVLERFKGDETPTVVSLQKLGGKVDGITMTVIPPLPAYEPGEEVLVFLHESWGHLLHVGRDQAKFTITVDAGTGERMLGRKLLNGIPERTRSFAGTDPDDLHTLRALVAEIMKEEE